MPKSIEIPSLFRFDVPDDASLVESGKYCQIKANDDSYGIAIFEALREKQPANFSDLDITKTLCRMMAEDSILPAMKEGAKALRYESHQDGDYATTFTELTNDALELAGLVFVRMKAGCNTIAVVSGTGDFEPLKNAHQVVYHSLHVLS